MGSFSEPGSTVGFHSTDGNEPPACVHTSLRYFYLEMWGRLCGRCMSFLCILHRDASMLPQKDHMGSGCWEHQRCSVWGRRGGMLHIGCECWDGASPHSHNSQMPLYSVPPPFIPPPLSSSSNKWSFCSSVFAAVGWQAPAGPKPQDYWTLLNLFFSCSL